jgi:hypothetical protein
MRISRSVKPGEARHESDETKAHWAPGAGPFSALPSIINHLLSAPNRKRLWMSVAAIAPSPSATLI